MKTEIDWSKSHNGVMLCTFRRTIELMPEVKEIIESLIPHLQYHKLNYLIDVKVHMLMPGEWPCIPNWHCDFLPRDENRKHIKFVDDDLDLMYIWTSGEPHTEFKTHQGNITTENGETWTKINQRDLHRGLKSEIHTWRCFIRLIPSWFVHPGTKNMGQIRRHSQVYIDDPQLFGW